MKYLGYPYGRGEALSGNYVVATYKVFGVEQKDALNKFGNYAVGQTVGTWVKVPGITEQMIEKYQARVVDFQLVSTEPEEMFLLRVAFPTSNFAGCFAAMLTGLLGNDVSTSLEVRLINLELINEGAVELGYQKKTTAPIEKLRKITNVYERPVILNMIKPCLGFDEKTGAEFFREVALGGVDIIKDDELLTNPHYNQVEKRVKAYRKAAIEVSKITGKETIFMPNITDRPTKMRMHAKAAIEAGAKACLINYMFTGLDAFSEICQEFEKDLFVMGHYAGIGIMDGDRCGMSNPVYLGMLARLAGADAVMTMFQGEEQTHLYLDCYKTVQQQMMDLNGIEKTVTTLGGGITPIHIPDIIKSFGQDIIIGVGGAIQGHPMGATEGAKAVMEAVSATQKNVSLRCAATSCKALETALQLWA